MPLPKGLARINRRVTNKVTLPFASRLPWFAVLRHTGRVSGDSYETPLMAWSDGKTVVVALTYGDDVDWLKNASAAEVSTMVVGGKVISVGRPEVVRRAEGYGRVPKQVGVALAALDIDQFVEFPILE